MPVDLSGGLHTCYTNVLDRAPVTLCLCYVKSPILLLLWDDISDCHLNVITKRGTLLKRLCDKSESSLQTLQCVQQPYGGENGRQLSDPFIQPLSEPGPHLHLCTQQVPPYFSVSTFLW